MKNLAPPSRRRFLATGLSLPLTAWARPAGQSETRNGVEYRTLGKTGLKVSTVGFGCMITSDASVIRKAVDMGINYFDTARVYQDGNNEAFLGEALKGRRKDVIISSKSPSRSQLEATRNLGLTLSALQTDYLDIWFLHGVSGAGELSAGVLGALQSAKKSGKIRFAGVSTHSHQAAVIKDAIKSGVIDVVLTAYNFAMEQKLTPLIDEAAKAGMGFVAMKVMAGGFQAPGYYPSSGELRRRFKRPGALLAALKWAIANPSIGSAIPSMVDMEQLEENFKAMSEPFSEADVKILSAHLENIRPVYCRMCGRCDGQCPQGVEVQDVLRALAYAEGYGQPALGRQTFRGVAGTGKCSACPTCTVGCPHGVEVAERMIRAQELFA